MKEKKSKKVVALVDAEVEDKATEQKLWCASVFALIGGLILAILAFLALFVVTEKLKEREMTQIYQQIGTHFEKKIDNLKDSMLGAQRLFNSGIVSRNEFIETSVYQEFFDKDQVLYVFFISKTGVYKKIDLTDDKKHKDISVLSNWTKGIHSFVNAKVVRQTKNEMLPFYDLPWLNIVENPDEKYIGFSVLRDDGVQIAVVELNALLKKGWTDIDELIQSIDVVQKQSASPILSYRSPLNSMDVPELFSGEYVFDGGPDMWLTNTNILPSKEVKVLNKLPWVIASMIMMMAAFFAFYLYKKALKEKEIIKLSGEIKKHKKTLSVQRTEHSDLLQALKKSDSEYRSMINSVSDVIFETDEEGRFVFLNASWGRITDFENAKCLGKSIFDLVHTKQKDSEFKMFKEFLSGNRQTYRSKIRLETAAGTYKAVELSFSMMRLADDQTLRVIGTITDIEKRHRTEQALRDAELKFREIVENSISGIYQTTLDGRFLSANPALAEILGYDDVADLMQSIQSLESQVYVDPADRIAFVTKIHRDNKIVEVESQFIKKNGDRIWVLENARAVRTDDGGIAYYEGSIWDITERRSAIESLSEAKIQAELSSRTKTEFLANMSHELRTPLNSIIGFSEVIKDEVMGPVGQDSYKEYAQDIYNSGTRLLEIISEILEISKIDIGQRQLTESNFSLQRVVRSCMTILNSKVHAAKLKVQVALPDGMPEILGEELVFKQILINLMNNAIKFTEAEGHITLSAQIVENGEMHIDITDTGCGMTAEEVVRAMQPFGQVNTALDRDTDGTGLGLTIVQSLIGLHNGRLEIISEKGKGTTARIVLPVNRVLSEMVAPTVSTPI